MSESIKCKNLIIAFRVATNTIRAHAAAYHAIHNLQSEARVELLHYIKGFNPQRPGIRRMFGLPACYLGYSTIPYHVLSVMVL